MSIYVAWLICHSYWCHRCRAMSYQKYAEKMVRVVLATIIFIKCTFEALFSYIKCTNCSRSFCITSVPSLPEYRQFLWVQCTSSTKQTTLWSPSRMNVTEGKCWGELTFSPFKWSSWASASLKGCFWADWIMKIAAFGLGLWTIHKESKASHCWLTAGISLSFFKLGMCTEVCPFFRHRGYQRQSEKLSQKNEFCFLQHSTKKLSYMLYFFSVLCFSETVPA